MKRSWWKVPLYCICAGWICFQVKVRWFGWFIRATLPDGSISVDNTRSLILSGVTLVVVLLVGGLFFFRKMTKKEIFGSASILVVLDIAFGLLLSNTPGGSVGLVAIYWAECSEWNAFVSQLLYQLTQNLWISAIVSCLSPYLFVLFGKRGAEE